MPVRMLRLILASWLHIDAASLAIILVVLIILVLVKNIATTYAMHTHSYPVSCSESVFSLPNLAANVLPRLFAGKFISD